MSKSAVLCRKMCFFALFCQKIAEKPNICGKFSKIWRITAINDQVQRKSIVKKEDRTCLVGLPTPRRPALLPTFRRWLCAFRRGGCELAKKFFQNFFAHSLRIHRVGFPSRKMPPLPPTRKFCWPSRPGRLPNIQYLRII